MRIRKLAGLFLCGVLALSCTDIAWAQSLAAIPGCAANAYQEYDGDFVANDFDLLNTRVENGHLVLNTGYAAIDPNKIVIPFTQDVSVTFLYEGGDYSNTDFGWMLASDGTSATKHYAYYNVNDNNNNGVLDVSADNRADKVGDINGDGVIDARDNKKELGTFAGGTELVFFLQVDDEHKTFYTKKDWNPDTYGSDNGECSSKVAGDSFTKTYHLGQPRNEQSDCTLDSNWMASAAYLRASELFGLTFASGDVFTLPIERNERFDHVIIGAPGNKPNEWVLGWEDLGGGGDTDHNDLIFQIERETGGVAQLQPNKTIVPDQEDAYITGVTIEVYDQMPCEGKTNVTYQLLHRDNEGEDFTEVDIVDWDEVYSFTFGEDGSKILGDRISDWTPGSPELTYRKRKVDLAALGLTPHMLSWRAKFTSQEEACEPEVVAIRLDTSIATHGVFSRSSPVTIANMLYSGNYKTPARDWSDKVMRGYLFATQLYDPHNPSTTAAAKIWEAGEKLSQKAPRERNIKFPKISLSSISSEAIATGDGQTKKFSGRLSNRPLLATSIIITDQTEDFHDKHTDVLIGDLGGTGTINRFTGEFEITFNTAPDNNQPITANYSYYTAQQQLLDFTANNLTNAMLGLDDTHIFPDGYIYDFNNDFTVDAADKIWLINWVRGYKNGLNEPKEWLLGPIDHSVPAAATPPGQPAWLFGTAVPAEERQSYQAFRDEMQDRKTVIYVGARDGMLHAFDAGNYRFGDNLSSHTVEERRGYFVWEDASDDCPSYCSSACSECPDYGTGEELWAFIPANLISRLKNNLLRTDDQAYVDASPALADVFISGHWRTILLSAEGNGGDTVFCLDVTDPDNPNFLWEFADPDLFRSRSSPSVAQIGRIVNNGTAKWVAFFVSGKTYDAGLYPSIYMIDIADGSVLRRIFLDAEAEGAGGVPSGQPSIIDSDGNGYIDRIYIGSDKGLMYKVNIPDDPYIKRYDLNHCVVNHYFDDGINQIPTDQQYHPIYGSPVVLVDNGITSEGKISYNVKVFFGTGDSPYYDENINTTETRYHFFAYRDENAKGECNEDAVHLDWFWELPEGHRIFASAFAAAGNIYFGTTTSETEDPCAPSRSQNTAGGSLFALTMQGSLVERITDVGDIITTPLVSDVHLYLRSQTLGLKSFGNAEYNNPTIVGGSTEFSMRNWRELF
jgi:type IV pilus assembly protein PilY1